jgi:hypothetical protein
MKIKKSILKEVVREVLKEGDRKKKEKGIVDLASKSKGKDLKRIFLMVGGDPKVFARANSNQVISAIMSLVEKGSDNQLDRIYSTLMKKGS